MKITHQVLCAVVFSVATLGSTGCSDVIVSGDVRSCATVGAGYGSCKHVTTSADGTRQVTPSGQFYSLPKGQVQLTWSRTKPTAGDVQKAQAALNTAQAAYAKDTQALATAQTKNPNDASLPGLQAQVQADDTAVQAATTGLGLAQDGQKSFVETATLVVQAVIPDPDPRARFVANLNHSALRNDTLTIAVSPSGLLNSVTATSADQTPQILQTLVNTAITFASIAGTGGLAVPPGGGIPGAPGGPPPASCTPDSLSIIFDPTNKAEVEDALARFSARTQNIVLEVVAPNVPDMSVAPPAGTDVTGLVYRAMTTKTLTLAPSSSPSPTCPLTTPPTAQSIVAVVPDSQTAYVVPARAGALTTSNFNFAFTNGTLTSYTNTQPSEIAAAVGIPIGFAQSLMSIPQQIIQLRLNYDTTATALVNQRSALNVAQTNALTAAANAQAQLVQAQSALTQAQIAAGAAGPTGQATVATAQTNLYKALATAMQAQQALNALVVANSTVSK